MNKKYNTLSIEPLSPFVGAEINGIDIAAGISNEQFAEIRDVYSDWGVVFFRDQNLTPDQHIAFAERWGKINVNRFFKPVTSHPVIAEVRKEPDQTQNIGSVWHTDHSYDQIPAMGSILYARTVPNIGGDTLFASMSAAYASLSEGMKHTLLGLRAEHSSRHVFGAEALDAGDVKDRFVNPEAATQEAVHPVVILHPLSDRPVLYINPNFTVKFEGWTKEESKPLLDYLYHHAHQSAFNCRFKWREGSVAIWDNRATHHNALNDYHGELRLMHRITIEGEPLVAA